MNSNVNHITPSQARHKVLKLAVPIMLANISVPLVGIVDTAVMGRMSEPRFIGAVAIGATLFSAIFWLFGFLRMGTGGLVAQALGEGKTELLQQTILRALLLALILGSMLIVLQTPLLSAGKLAFAAKTELLDLTARYYNIRIWSAPATLMLYAVVGALVGVQKMKSVLATQLFLNLLNVVLTLYFFFHLNWGIEGVALASVLSDFAALVLGLYLLYRANLLNPSRLSERSLYQMQEWHNLVVVNGNLMIRTLCLILAFYWLTATSTRFGETTLAANALLIQMLHFMAYALDGFAHTAETLGGRAYGQRHVQSFKAYIRASYEWACVFAILFAVFYQLTARQLLTLMTSIDSVVDTAMHFMPWIAIAPVVSVWSFILDGIFIGVTYSKTMRNGMLLSLVVFISATLVLIPIMGNHGLWLSYLILMGMRAATLGVRYGNILKQFQA